MPLLETLTDNFNDNSIDPAKWVGGGTYVVETNQELEISTTTASSYNSLWNAGYTYSYDLTGSQGTVKIVDAGDQTIVSYEFFPLKLSISGGNDIKWLISGGNIKARNGGTVLASTAYVAATHKYLKIRESAGTTYWDYSSDGLSWTNFYSTANLFAVTALL